MPYRRSAAVQARLDAQEETILRAGVSLLAERGYAGLSINAVATEAGVATGTVYKHFASKADLAAAVFRRAVGHEVDAVVRASSRAGSTVERLTAGVETFAMRALKNPRLAYALLAEPVDPAVDEQRLAYRRTFASAFETVIRDGVADGSIPPQNAALSASALVGAVGEVLIGPLADNPVPEAVIPELIAFSVRALGV
ncbi:TetR/AcrR family transcriptional regulator [Aldersonia kunmingensis]|uniref:TetR/AcrR family transcriptional regulator n=1 Tax=Aldersonia kunmingensis TaxID=408066 RepID=UPI00082F13D7|nr:TetR/AcrR family transcriptional regulator [Aldersonia kunmingensis]